MQRLGFLEWNVIAAENLYRSFELRLGVLVFSLSRRDDCLGPRHYADESAPVFAISDYLPTASEMFVSVLDAVFVSVDQRQLRSML